MGGKKTWELMLEIGHKSTPLTKKLPNGYTHKWTAFVRGVNNSKIENCISHVVFQLHDSFENPYRDISQPPFQIKETGYAGFEIPIQIFFRNRDKPNQLGFVHDLILLTNKRNNNCTVESIKFINPNKEFEKCLLKSGAQLLQAPPKKDRCESPPAKKQKSSCLIPSKDMSQLSQQQQPQTQSHHHQSHHKSSHQNHSSHNTNNSQSKHQVGQSHHQHTNSKPKSSNAFIDVFGKPLVYNNNNSSSNSNNFGLTTSSNNNSHSSHHHNNNNSNHHHHHNSSNHHHSGNSGNGNSSGSGSGSSSNNHTSNTNGSSTHHSTSTVAGNINNNSSGSSSSSSKHSARDPLLVIQSKISNLSDCDKLQKIVDIIEESGEWFNLTSKKFEFDLKRLDKKTLSRIERCLHH